MPGKSILSGLIFTTFYRERIIFLGKDADDERSNQIIAVDAAPDSKIQVLFICISILPGEGRVTPGMAIYDTM